MPDLSAFWLGKHVGLGAAVVATVSVSVFSLWFAFCQMWHMGRKITKKNEKLKTKSQQYKELRDFLDIRRCWLWKIMAKKSEAEEEEGGKGPAGLCDGAPRGLDAGTLGVSHGPEIISARHISRTRTFIKNSVGIRYSATDNLHFHFQFPGVEHVSLTSIQRFSSILFWVCLSNFAAILLVSICVCMFGLWFL